MTSPDVTLKVLSYALRGNKYKGKLLGTLNGIFQEALATSAPHLGLEAGSRVFSRLYVRFGLTDTPTKMSGRFQLRRLYKPLAYAAAATATSSIALYATSKPRGHNEPQAIPYTRDENGRIIPPRFPSIKSRAEQIADLKCHSSTQDEIYDLLIIGGGATGTGIALDAATRGLRVALVEREDFSSGTSSKSTKLVHGGVRYLEKAFWNLDYSQYQLVKEALKERKNFLFTAPHLSSSLAILLPLYKWWEAPYFWAGTKAYDLLAGSEGLESSYFLTKNRALEQFPLLKKDNLVGALVYYDGQHNDSRMNVSLAMTAALYGATMVNHIEVTGLEKDENGKLCGARVRDMLPERDGQGKSSEQFIIRARGIINATGPFTDAIEQMDEPTRKDIVAPSSGVHIVLPGHLSPKNMGLLDPATSDGRVIFFLPWEGSTIAGTTDAPCGIERNPVASEEDIGFILKEVNKYITPEIDITRDDVLAAWSGIRPLVRDPNSANTESLVRNHLVTVSKSGLLTCAGGKWTTYRQMAEDAVDLAMSTFNLQPGPLPSSIRIGDQASSYSDIPTTARPGSCTTPSIRLLGSHGYSKTLYISLIQTFNLPADIAQHLALNYGDRAWEVASLISEVLSSSDHIPRLSRSHPFTPFEVLYSVRREYAQTATDVLARRTRLSFLDAQAAYNALPTIIDIMGKELHWTQARKDMEFKLGVEFLGSMGLKDEFKLKQDQNHELEHPQENLFGHVSGLGSNARGPRFAGSPSHTGNTGTGAGTSGSKDGDRDRDRDYGFRSPVGVSTGVFVAGSSRPEH
ncbi:putative glycerol-3-phosphate mitochondrial [Phaeomoniella chlamydospora]|uniref:Glycerol-3-phosphate dehydrogenase n=1 Tax=Phaeomoniella chlamydospora TaxID=158046 RepID=A0A0G2EKX9_PHACM|nr:putative glycerol-3-phosphate mitochondrial [Phaeomoniella chlamydospora]